MIISVASGKGGTGKTTVATNLAASLDADVQLLDCDVEEPNAHLFLRPQIEETETTYTLVPKIDNEKCSYCGKCVDICRFNAIVTIGKTTITFPELCHSCGGCLLICPERAITEGKRELGVIERGKAGNIDFVHGRLRIGEAMAPPLIRKVRSYLDSQKINIIDAPPGTSCPVITAIKDTDFVLMVTEPTPFGLHDLKLGVGAVKILGIPHGLIINRSDMGNQDVWNYAQQENIPILLEIPFARKIAETYSQGKLIVDVMPEWKQHFARLYESINKLIGKSA